jgi:hypothetical protein
VTGVSRATASTGWKEVTHADLLTNLGVSDLETTGTSLILQVESLGSGQSLKIGTSGSEGGSSVYTSSNKQVTSTKSIYWKGPENLMGIFDAVKFTVIDGGNVSSPTQGLLRMNVDTGSNAAPTINAGNVSMGTGYAVGKPFSISYSTLAAAAAVNVADSDNSYVTLVITSISNGSIKKGSTTMVATVGASQANPVTPNANSQLVSSESLVFFPTSTTTGSAVTLATVRGYDGTTYSANEATLQATFTATANQIPVITYVKDFTGAVKDTAFSFTYDSLRGDPSLMAQGTQRTDAYDAEENIASKSLKFRVKSEAAGSALARTSPSAYAFTGSGTETIEPGQSFTWTPPSGSTGRQAAFSIVAYDDTNEGSNSAGTAVQVHVYVNKDPTFTNSTNLITGINENSPYTITYDKLFTTYPSSDDSTGILGYQIYDLSGAAGTLQRYVSGVATAVTTPYTMYPGDQILWTPPNHQNVTGYPTHQLFKLRLVDGENATSTAIDVKGVVTAVNTAPVYLSATSLSSVAKNAVKTITYDDIFAAIDFREYDVNTSAKPALGDNHGLRFRIESVNAGTLVGSNGTAIAPTPGNVASMKYLVKSGSQDLSSSWSSLSWTPPSNLTGTFTIMKVRLYDGEDFSDGVASIQISVTAGNATPTFTTSAFTYSPGIGENDALLVKYDDLVAYTGAADADGDVVKFKVSWLSSGSLTIGGTNYTSAGAIGAEPSIGPGQTFVWKPAANTNGTLAAFKVKLTDTVADSTEVTASVIVSDINQAPTIANTAITITGATRYTSSANPFAISYATLSTALGLSDPDIVGNYTITVTNWLGGQGIGSSSVSNCSSSVTYFPSSVSMNSGSTYFCWIPPAAVTGTYAAFRVSVADNNNALSGQTALVSINITGSDSVPSYLSGCYANTTLNSAACTTTGEFGKDGTYFSTFDINKTGAGAGTYIDLSYERLKALTGARDIDSAPIQFVVTYVNGSMLDASSTLIKLGTGSMTAYTGTGTPAPAATQLIGPGETMRYSLGSSLGSSLGIGSTYDLLGIKLYDGNSITGITEKRIKVITRNGATQVPTVNFSAPIPLYSTAGGTAGAIQATTYYRLTYAELRNYIDAYDLDDQTWSTSTLRVVGGGTYLTGTTTNGMFTNVVAMYRDSSTNCSSLLAITNGTNSTAGASSYSELISGNAICFQVNSTATTSLNASNTNTLTILQLAIVQAGSTVAKYIPLQIRRGD